jgi:hypothetical protein
MLHVNMTKVGVGPPQPNKHILPKQVCSKYKT